MLAGHIIVWAGMLAWLPSSDSTEEPEELAWLLEEQLETNFLPRGIAALDWGWVSERGLLLTNSLGQLAGKMRPH